MKCPRSHFFLQSLTVLTPKNDDFSFLHAQIYFFRSFKALFITKSQFVVKFHYPIMILLKQTKLTIIIWVFFHKHTSTHIIFDLRIFKSAKKILKSIWIWKISREFCFDGFWACSPPASCNFIFYNNMSMAYIVQSKCSKCFEWHVFGGSQLSSNYLIVLGNVDFVFFLFIFGKRHRSINFIQKTCGSSRSNFA